MERSLLCNYTHVQTRYALAKPRLGWSLKVNRTLGRMAIIIIIRLIRQRPHTWMKHYTLSLLVTSKHEHMLLAVQVCISKIAVTCIWTRKLAISSWQAKSCSYHTDSVYAVHIYSKS